MKAAMGSQEKETQELPRTGGRPPLVDWHKVLIGEPSAVLDRLRSEDLLDLFPRCSHRVREKAYFLDTHRVYELCMAHVAFKAPQHDKEESIVDWLFEQVDDAIHHTLRQDQRVHDSGIPPDEEDPNYLFIVDNLFMHPAIACAACVDFNNLDDRTREIFFILFDGSTIDQCSAQGYGDREEIGEAMRRALFALKYLDPDIKFDNKGDLVQ